jgi:hypothetical protein
MPGVVLRSLLMTLACCVVILNNTRLSDAGLKKLVALKQLKELHLGTT